MAQAKITISREQAQKLGLLTIHTKTKSFMLYDPKSGITLRETKAGETITVPDGVNTYNLERFLASGYFTVAEGTLSQTAANADQDAPTNLEGVAPTSVENNDGKITGTTTDMEYTLKGEEDWTEVTGTEITGLAAGTYEVRLAAKTGYNAGATAEVVVAEYVAPASDDATLSDLKVDGTTVAGFAADIITYDVKLAAGTTTVPTVVGTVTDTGKANAVVTDATELPGSTTVVVTAEDGTTTKVYTISFTFAEE